MTTGTDKAVDRQVRVGNLNLHYLESGSATNPPVIMVHGLSGNAHAFDALAPHFVAKFHVFSVDVRGRGHSDWAEDGDYSNEAYVGDLEGLRAALGLERFSLVGTSMGGRISLAYAGTYPDRVERAVINDIGPEVDPRGGERIRIATRDASTFFQTMDEVLAWHRQQRPAFNQLSDEQQRLTADYAVKSVASGGFTWKMDPVVRQNPRRPAPEASWAQAMQITAPLLLVRGAESDLLSIEVAERMVRELHDCRMVEVPGVGHAPTLMEPEAFNAIKKMFSLA